MRTNLHGHGLMLPHHAADAPRTRTVFWLAAIAAAGLALLAVYGSAGQRNTPAASGYAGPVSPLGELVQLAERIGGN